MAKKKRLLPGGRDVKSRPPEIFTLTLYLTVEALFFVWSSLSGMYDMSIGASSGPDQGVLAVLGIPFLFLGLLLCVHAWAFNRLHKRAYPIARLLFQWPPRWFTRALGVYGLIDKSEVRRAFGYPPLPRQTVYDDYGHYRYAAPNSLPAGGPGSDVRIRRGTDPLGLTLLVLGIIGLCLSILIPPIPLGLGLVLAALGGLLVWLSR